MGFFDDIDPFSRTGFAGRGALAITPTLAGIGSKMNPFDPVMGGLNDRLNPQSGGDPNAPNAIDSRIGTIAGNQAQQATDFRSNLPQYEDAQANAAGDQARRSLASNMAGIKSNANARGLLYSGIRQGQEADAGAQAASGLAQRRAQINNESEDKANTLDNQALQSGMGMRTLQQDQYNTAYQKALNQQAQKQQGQNQLMGGIGGLIGALI